MGEEAILWLGQKGSMEDRSLIGSKAAGLCAVRGLGLAVPPGFCVTTVAFRAHLETHRLDTQIARRLAGSDVSSTLEEIRQLLIGAPLARQLRERLATAYDRLGTTAVAVRSSATAEDLPGHSFAGQYETILGVTSLEACLDAIKQCWASLWTERAYEYRCRNGIDHQQVEMAVIVQRQIDADVAGVAFTLDPITGSPSRIVIESCTGLGDALVSGRVQPDRIVLRKKNLELARQTVANGGAEASLSLRMARKLARRVRKLETRLGGPQDVEWAINNGRIWFLQARPITAVPELKAWEDRQVWTNFNLGEVVPDVMTPMTFSMIDMVFDSFARAILRLVGVRAKDHFPAGLVAGRLYWHINFGLAAAQPFTSMEKLRRANSMFGGEQERLFDSGAFDLYDEDLPDLGFSWPRYILSWPRVIYDLVSHRTARGDASLACIRACNEQLERLDIDATGSDELARMVSETLLENLRKLDLLLLLPGFLAVMLFQRACRRWLGDEDLILAARLMAAQGGIADTEAGLDLWRLAALAHEDRETEHLLLAGGAWADIRGPLSETESGRQFLTAWNRFMTEYGHHCRGELEFLNTRWAERPDYVLGLVRGYLRSVGQADPLQRQQQLAREGAELAALCRQKLKNPFKRWLFNGSLERTRKVSRDRENWKNEVVRQIAVFRRILLMLGERLCEDRILACREDIFFLTIPEIRPIVQGHPDFDVKEQIAARRAEYERNCAVTPPPVVVGRFDPDTYAAPEVDTDVEVLHGIAVSPGVVTGRARVILRTDEDQHVEAGEILVAPFTDPAWTPYFLPAAGVVMDMGGVLSHGAIIAREYGIPAVVNVGPASKIIQTGQEICVDADRGIVTIL
jgi:pyruvate,water dikinase